eukprot:1148956-Pelagomonas_calceolata.AAC.1
MRCCASMEPKLAAGCPIYLDLAGMGSFGPFFHGHALLRLDNLNVRAEASAQAHWRVLELAIKQLEFAFGHLEFWTANFHTVNDVLSPSGNVAP